MKIVRARVEGFRSIGILEIDFDGLTALVGSGGVGKSAFLRAVNWFFEGGDLDAEDLHRPLIDEEPAERVMVAITFADLNDLDRRVLGRYASEEPTTLTRSWQRGERASLLSGTALAFGPFDPIREADSAAELNGNERAVAEADAKDAATQNQRLLTLCGEDPAEWPEQMTRPASANFADDLETYLEEEWDEMNVRLQGVAAELAMEGKSAAVYHQAAVECDDVPPLLTDILSRVRDLA